MKVKFNLFGRLFRKLLDKLRDYKFKKYKKRCFTSIYDLPVHNWWKINETNNFTHLFKKEGKVNEAFAIEIFSTIYREFIEEFGISREHELYLMKCAELEVLQIAVANGERYKKAFVEICKLELKEMTQGMEKVVKDHGISNMEMEMGLSIDPMETAVYTFYRRVRAIKDKYESKKNK